MNLLLGVDGGFTKTAAAVADPNGRVLGVGVAGCGSVEAAAGTPGAMREIAASVESALTSAGVRPEDLSTACFGLAGADGVQDVAEISAALAEYRVPGALAGQRYVVVNDGLVALRGGLVGDWGIVSTGGTGTVVVGRHPDGRIVQVGGTGFLFGDLGGGGEIGRMAFRAVTMADQGARPPTALRGPIVSLVGREDVLSLQYEADTLWVRSLSKIAPVVFDCAAQGDEAAQEILLTVGRELGRMAIGGVIQLGLEHERVEVVLAGSTFRGRSPLMEDQVRLTVHLKVPRAWVHRAVREPVAGSLIIAKELAGEEATAAFRDRLKERLPGPGPGEGEIRLTPVPAPAQ